MTPKEHREALLQGRDVVCNAIIAFLFLQGWRGDRLLKNIANKEYAPHKATVRVVDDLEYPQYWVNCEYTSVGHNVASGCTIVIQAQASQAEIESAMTLFLRDAEKCINSSFAVRYIGDGRRFAPEAVLA